MNEGRICILLLDSLGIGASLDANLYGDEGADTFGHIVQACKNGFAESDVTRHGELRIPNLARRGLYHAAIASSGKKIIDLATIPEPEGLYGYAVEQSLGKDTPSGHWELAGLPVMTPWGYFPDKKNCFPKNLIDTMIKSANLPGVLGEKHASGTEIINELGDEHIKSKKPIVYTSADSVFQIAAHEEYFGLENLYKLCEIARKLVDKYQIGRVIARPFIGESGNFSRTGNRKDYATPPPSDTLLDKLVNAGNDVISIGKVADIFAHRGFTKKVKANGNMSLFDATLKEIKDAKAGSLIFTNFVDFDSSYGHRRDITGYAHALEEFDKRMPEIDNLLNAQDLVIISADHGCDPTFPGTDHTREHVPVLVYGKNIPNKFIGRRDSFADIGQSIAKHLQIEPVSHGVSFL
ncbi:MAG: phosphopentomutase [Legionellales bacterium RIFCSPHIGHO2_12_FULL_35_11]|nr:MAG: phosphopentomutase [Legionellales bacterium RIFCSPHIGHO2_12_FULL_35_11]